MNKCQDYNVVNINKNIRKCPKDGSKLEKHAGIGIINQAIRAWRYCSDCNTYYNVRVRKIT